MTRLQRIDWHLARTSDKKLVALLNRAYWREFFRLLAVSSPRREAA